MYFSSLDNESDRDEPLKLGNGCVMGNGYSAVRNKMNINVNPLSHLDIDDDDKPDDVRVFIFCICFSFYNFLISLPVSVFRFIKIQSV